MHYKIKDLTIKSENAAKSVKQPNKQILRFIDKLTNEMNVLDYGCGKLRYTIPLAKKVLHTSSVDSLEQVEKIQIINGHKTSVRKYVNKYLPDVDVYDLQQKEWKKREYDFIICCNVLSAIPIYNERLNIFINIKQLLKADGKALITTQYSNSYFSMYKYRKDCIKFYDGWIIKNKDKHSFYGIINLNKLIYYSKISGLNVHEAYNKDGSAYLIVSK